MSNPFGSVFSDEIIRGNRRKKLSNPGDEEETTHPLVRTLFFVFLLVFGLGILAARLFSVTVIEGERYRKLSTGNRIREIKIPAPRGIIYDRNKIPLVRNIPVFEFPDGGIYFEEKPASESGIAKETITRQYVYGNITPHVLGFTGEITGDELKTDKNGEYSPGDIVGKMGIEKQYDRILRGKEGREMIETDALGQTVRVLGRIEPNNGQNINLSLDLSLQKVAASLLAGKKGAIVVENPVTGEVLALYSSPAFDPNDFIRNVSLPKLLSDEEKPLFDRSISGLYAPGSTFKIVTAISALQSGAITGETEFEDTGILQVGPYSFGNWYFLQYGKKDGFVNVVNAIRRSNDIFFYKTGEAVGIEKMSQWAKKVGIGTRLGIDIPGETAGLMPDPVWANETKGEDWYLGNTYHVAIGQGDLLVTPLQVNAWTNVIANGGKLCGPHLIKAGNDDKCKDLGIKKEYIDLIKKGMKGACSEGGTGWPLFNFKVTRSVIPDSFTLSQIEGIRDPIKIDGINFFEAPESTISGKPSIAIPVACKTGTAEYGDPGGKTHAWFTVFAPVMNPQISITVLVEGGGEGSSVAAPMAKKILEEWFTNQD